MHLYEECIISAGLQVCMLEFAHKNSYVLEYCKPSFEHVPGLINL